MMIMCMMKSTLRRHILPLATSILLLASPLCGSARSWDIARLEVVPDAKIVVKQVDMEIRASRGVIYIVTNRPVQVKVYSILGHLVAQSSLQSGNYKMTLNNHGVYLIKIGDLTCKVAV